VAQPVALAPPLQLEQLDLQQPLVHLVVVARHALVVRVVLPPGVDVAVAGMHQHRIVVVVIPDRVSLGCQRHRLKISAPGYRKVAAR
jgi:hypothetical protein